jgi:L-aspartate oxidase
MTHPTLIIGAGIAGLWAALKMAPQPVILLTGSPLGEGAASGWAQGGVSAALSDDDDASLHARDTIEAGAGLVDLAAADALAMGAADEVRALAALGAPLERDGNDWSLSQEAAHSRARVARVKGDGAGAAIMGTLIQAVREAGHIDIRDGCKALTLLSDETGNCLGAQAITPRDKVENIHAGNTILAMGGAGGLFALTTTPAGAQGQAMAMAARLGATIQDPEFVQFHPTAINAGLDPAPLATEALRGEGATLIDRTGHRFMKAVHPDAELAPRDVVARAVHRQNQTAKGAFLDCTTAVGNAFPTRFPAVFAACQQAGIDPRIEPIPIAPTAHYHMGGVATDIDGRTDVAGLWAIGECASTGLHGANRLASNSLAEGLVSAARVTAALNDFVLPHLWGRYAEGVEGEYRPADLPPPSTKADTSPINGGGQIELPPTLPLLALQRLRQAMSQYAGVERCETGLTELIAIIEAMLELYGDADALIAAQFIAHAALQRCESRGGHFRTDHPASDEIASHTRLRLTDLHRAMPQPFYQTCPAE